MADVQLEHGHTQIADELLEALARVPMSGTHYRVMLALIRKIYGYRKTADRVGSVQVALIAGVDASDARRCLRDLTAWGLITRTGGGGGRGDSPLVRIVKDFDQWSVTVSSEARRRSARRQKGAGNPPHNQEAGGQKGAGDTPLIKGGDTQESGGTLAIKRGDKRHKGGGQPPTQERTRENKRECGADAPPTPPQDYSPEDAHPLANVIAQLPGDRPEKLCWLDSGIGLEILYAADAEAVTKGLEVNSLRKQIVSARWRKYIGRGEREFRELAERAVEREAAEARRRARQTRDPPALPARPPTPLPLIENL